MGTSQSREDHISDSDDYEEDDHRQSDDEDYQDAEDKHPTPIGDIDAKLKALKLKYGTPPPPSSSSSSAVSHNAVKLYLHIGGNTPNAKWIVSNKMTSYSFVKTSNVDGDSDDDEYGRGLGVEILHRRAVPEIHDRILKLLVLERVRAEGDGGEHSEDLRQGVFGLGEAEGGGRLGVGVC